MSNPILPAFIAVNIFLMLMSQSHADNFPVSNISKGSDYETKKINNSFGAVGKPVNGGVTPPAEFDWRSFYIVSPVLNQGLCGSCWSFTACSVYDSKLYMKGWTGLQISPQQQVSCNQEMNSCCGGQLNAIEYWDFAHANKPILLSSQGYVEGATDCNNLGAVAVCQNLAAPNSKLPNVYGYYSLNVIDNNLIKNSIWWDGPAIFGIYFLDNDNDINNGYEFANWWNTAKNGNVFKGSIGMRDIGGHAVTLIGWSDLKQAWLLKNSWGQGGPNGDGTFWFAYDGHKKANGIAYNPIIGISNSGLDGGNIWGATAQSTIYSYSEYTERVFTASAGSAKIVAGDPRGRIWIVDFHANTIWKKTPRYSSSLGWGFWWSQVGTVTAKDISTATTPNNTYVYIAGTDNSLKVLNTYGTDWNNVTTTYNGTPVLVSKVDVDNNGTVYIVSTTGQVYRRYSITNTWEFLSGIAATDIGVNYDDQGREWIYACDGNKYLYRWTGRGWDYESPRNVTAVDVSIKNQIVILKADGSVLTRSTNQWKTIVAAGSKLTDIGCASWR